METKITRNNIMYLFDLTKINCSIYLIVKSLYHIIDICKIKYFICNKFIVANKIFNLAHIYYMIEITLKFIEYSTYLESPDGLGVLITDLKSLLSKSS